METFEGIDIEGKSLTCSGKDLAKLNTEEGCPMHLVTQKVFNLDDGSLSDQELDYEDSTITLTREAKLERMKREFISLTYNANQDPLKHDKKSRPISSFTEDTAAENAKDDLQDLKGFGNLDDGYTRIHKRYKKMGEYEAILSKDENHFREVSSDRVFKRTIVSGSGPLIDEKSLAIYNCAMWTEGSSDPFDSTWLRHNAIITEIASDSVIPGIRELLLTMKSGEWCEAFIRPEAAFGPLGVKPRIKPNATVFCVLEVVKVVPTDKISLLSLNPVDSQKQGVTFEEFYAASDEARTRGNYYLDKGQYKVALQRYKSGIRILEALTFKDENEEKKANLLLVKLFNNSARAANAAKVPRLALSFCKRASLIDDMNPKTHWQRMLAWKNKGHYDRSLNCARRALQLFPKDRRAFQKEAEVLIKKIHKDKMESDDLFRLMGRAISDPSTTAQQT